METQVCIYCRRTLDLSQLLERGGKYRCKDENGCLEYQNRDDSVDSGENADYISDVVKSSLMEARQRIAAYKTATDDLKKIGTGDHDRISEESIPEFAWMKSVVDVLASEYKENHKYIFQYDGTNNPEYRIAFNDADNQMNFTVRIHSLAGSGYALTVARGETTADQDRLYDEFIYKSYPGDQREDVVQDLSVMLIAFQEEKGILSALLNAFRMEIESGSYHHDSEGC